MLKSIFRCVFLFVSFSLIALANSDNFEGTFVKPTIIPILGYANSNTCLGDGGNWDSRVEWCMFKDENRVSVGSNSRGYQLLIETVGPNGHECYFNAEAKKGIVSHTLVSKVGDCEVTITYLTQDTVDVATNNQCHSYCGARAWLEMGEAHRR